MVVGAGAALVANRPELQLRAHENDPEHAAQS
jgi:hypothetical protein